MSLAEAYYRRLYAFHTPSPVEAVEFYNHAHSPTDGRFIGDRDTGGRAPGGKIGTGSPGGKVWTGVSANPDNRVKPKAKISFPIEPEGYESKGDARALLATRVYDADLGDGYTARVSGVKEIHDGISVNITLRKGMKKVGQSSRELVMDGAGRLVANHETLYIDAAHQGYGLADRFNSHAIAEYQKLGVDRITLHAGADVGGYAWARQGFRIFEGDRKKFLHEQLDRVETQLLKPVLRPHAKKIRAEVAALKKAIDAGEDVQPIHIASLGEQYARHTGRTDDGNEYPTWPGKSVLIGTNWLGEYYFDANRAVTAAAVNLEHATLRNEQFYNHAHDPNTGRFARGGVRRYDDAGTWGNSWQNSSTITGQSADIMGISGYFPGSHPARKEYDDDRYGLRLDEGRQKATELLGAIHDAVPFKKPLYSGIYLETQRFTGLRPGDRIALPTTATSPDRQLAHESGRSPYDGDPWHAAIKPEAPIVLKFEAGTKAVKYQHNYREMITAGHFEVVSVDRVKSPYEVHKRELNDLPIADTIEITLRQTHTVDPTQPITAAGQWDDFACHDKSCAPPPAGTGGSLQARRGVVPGYGPTRRRDITLGSVKVTYHPDYPDGHPDPGEVVWAKVRYQEDVNQSKDRPVLIIGRINGSDKLAAVQLTSNTRPDPSHLQIGPGSWDRLGRNSAVKLDQIIVVDPKDYRREGSKFERDKFEGVIGRLAAFHRTPVAIAAAGLVEELYNHNHDRHSGRFTSNGASNLTFKVITAAQARGDSRPVSHEEFQRLANVGRTQLEGFARHAKKIDLTDEQWTTIKSSAYTEARQSWGGATIDMHTGHPLPQGANAYAITVKRLALENQKKSQNTISIHENASEAEFNAAMDQARARFGYTLAREKHYLGVFHDDENHRIDFDPVLVVTKREDVDTIGAATHAIGGAYNFSDGNGYWPPHVSE